MQLLHSHNLNCVLADEMGLGKTIQTICHLGLLLRAGNMGPHLVCVPASTYSNWLREFAVWCPALVVLAYRGSQKERNQIQAETRRPFDFQVLLTTYEMCVSQKDDRKFMQKLRFSYMVLDEAHCLKNENSVRYKHLAAIKARHIILLTGTPIQNNLSELAALASFILPGSKENFEVLLGATSDLEERAVARRVRKILGPFVLRRLKAEVLDEMVPKSSTREECEMTPTQAALYKTIIAKCRKDMLNAEQDKVEPPTLPDEESKSKRTTRATAPKSAVTVSSAIMNNLVMQLRKCANHPLLHRSHFTDEIVMGLTETLLHMDVYQDFDKCLEYLMGESDFRLHQLVSDYNRLKHLALPPELVMDSGKVQRLKILLPQLKEEGHRALIFSQFTQMLDILEEVLKQLGYRYLRLDGQTAVAERQAMLDEYNAPGSPIFVFLLSTKAGGAGINLATADTVITHDIDWNPFNDRQAEDRCHRIGQTRPVTCYRLTSKDTIEEHMWNVAAKKRRLDEMVLDNSQDGQEGSEEAESYGADGVAHLDLRKLLEATINQISED